MATKVNRWDNVGSQTMSATDDGLFVKYSDYAELESKLARQMLSIKESEMPNHIDQAGTRVASAEEIDTIIAARTSTGGDDGNRG